MSASVDILYHATRQGFDISEVPTTIDYSVENASTHHPIKHGLALGRTLLRTIERDRPLSALGAPGFLALLIGVVIGFWTIQNFVRTGTFPYGLAITFTFFMLAGIFLVFMAIVLHSLNRQLER